MGTLQRLGPRKLRHEATFRGLTVCRVLGSRLQQFEMTFPRLLHLLAHHPDFQMTHACAMEMSRFVEFVSYALCIDRYRCGRYVKFYTLTVVTADNVSLIFHLAEKVKTVRDAESDRYSEACVSPLQCSCSVNHFTFSQHMYALSDLSQRMIQSYARARSWTLTNIPAGKTKLPSDIFHPLPDAATANKVREVVSSAYSRQTCIQILRTKYLPEETYQWLEGQGKVTKSEPKV